MSNDPTKKQQKLQFRLTRSTMGLSLAHNKNEQTQAEEQPPHSYVSEASLRLSNLPQSTQIWPNEREQAANEMSTTDMPAKQSGQHAKNRSKVNDMGSGSVAGTVDGGVSSDSGTYLSLTDGQSIASQMSAAQCATPSTAISTAHFRERIQKYREESAQSDGDAARMHCELNDIYVRRLEDIDCLEADDINLRLVIYQEWVDLLLNLNATVFGNITKMETESFNLLRECFCRVNIEQNESEELVRKLRKDICALIRIIQNGYHKNCWNFEDINLETLEFHHILSTKTAKSEANTEQHVKALACEVAEKYDEICQLRAQISCLENDIQVAHQKIILKDETIARLRGKLEQAATEHQTQSMPTTCEPCATLPACPSLNKANNETQYDCLAKNEHMEYNLIKKLNRELDELFEMSSDNKILSLENHRKRLDCLVRELVRMKSLNDSNCQLPQSKDPTEACHKLNLLREQLLNLELDNDSDCIKLKQSVACGCRDDNDIDAKIIEMLKMNLNDLNATNQQTQLKSSRLQLALKNLDTEYKSKMHINDINCRMLKEMADWITDISRAPFKYEQVYTEDNVKVRNPFCAAMSQMLESAKAKKALDEINALRSAQHKAKTGK